VDESIRLTIEHGFRELLAYGLATRGFVLVALDRAQEAIVQLQEALALFRKIGSKVRLTQYYASVAEAYLKLGLVKDFKP
jgi:hypothetical protein